MKIKHLIEGYNFNCIPAKINNEVEESGEKAGVIKFTEDIYASYLLDEEEFVSGLNIFINAVKQNNKEAKGQLGNLTQSEANSIMTKLGLFNGKLKEKAVRLIDYIYEIKPENGIIIFSMLKENKEIPPVKSQSQK